MLAAAGETETVAEPVAEVWTVSLTLTVWLPEVLRLTALVKVWEPLSPATKL